MPEGYMMMPHGDPEQEFDDGNPMPGPGVEDDVSMEELDGNPMPGPVVDDDV